MSSNSCILDAIGVILLTSAWAIALSWFIEKLENKYLAEKNRELQERVIHLEGELNRYHPARTLQSQSRVGGISR